VDRTYGPAASFAALTLKSPASCTTARTAASDDEPQGGFVNSSGTIPPRSQVILPYVVGSLEVYDQTTAWPVVVENTS